MNRPAAVMAILAVVLAGCAAPETAPPEAAEPQTASPDRLTVIVEGTGEPRFFHLRCRPPGGTHPYPRLACEALQAAGEPFAPVSAGDRCHPRPAGPEHASIRGTWQGERVELALSRDDSCQNARWMSLLPLFVPRTPGL